MTGDLHLDVGALLERGCDVVSFDRVPSELEPPAMDLFYEPPMSLPTVHFLELGA